jgi:hypothetical protein
LGVCDLSARDRLKRLLPRPLELLRAVGRGRRLPSGRLRHPRGASLVTPWYLGGRCTILRLQKKARLSGPFVSSGGPLRLPRRRTDSRASAPPRLTSAFRAKQKRGLLPQPAISLSRRCTATNMELAPDPPGPASNEADVLRATSARTHSRCIPSPKPGRNSRLRSRLGLGLA